MKKENVPQHERAFVPLTDDIKRKLMRLYEKDARDEVEDQLLERGDMKVTAADFDILRFRLYCTFYANQPWHVRKLKSQKDRISIARRDAETVVSDYLKGLTEDMLKLKLDIFCLEVEDDWDKHWLDYIHILETNK